MYDKFSVLRVETTINNPRELGIFGTVHHRDGTESKQWKPMGKSIDNLYRYAKISKACNTRFLDAVVDIVPVKSTLKEIKDICSGKKTGGRKVPGFNVWSKEVVLIIKMVCDRRYLVQDFRNKDIRREIFPDIKDRKKQSSRTSRILKKLRQHGLIKKVPRSRRYHVTSKGHRIMGVLIEIRHREYPVLVAKKA